MKIPIVSHIYPTKSDPSNGIFIQKEAQLINTLYKIEVYVPRVLSTPYNKQFYRSYQLVSEKFPVNTLRYISIPKRMLASVTQMFLSRALYSAISASNSNLVHLHWLYPGGLAAPLLKKRGYKVLLTIHGGDWYSNLHKNRLNETLRKSLFACDHIITVGHQLKKDIISTYPDLSDKITHIPHAIDTHKFSIPNSKNHTKQNLGWQLSKTHLLCVANLYKVKGVDLLVEAFANLEIDKNIHLHIIAPRGDNDMKKKINSLIATHQLQKSITFYNAMTENEIVNFYQAADLFISPSLKEGFGLAIAEAAACGTPVLATKSGGPQEIVSTEIGQLVEPGDINQLRKGIETMLLEIKNYNSTSMHKIIKSQFSKEYKRTTLGMLYDTYISS